MYAATHKLWQTCKGTVRCPRNLFLWTLLDATNLYCAILCNSRWWRPGELCVGHHCRPVELQDALTAVRVGTTGSKGGPSMPLSQFWSSYYAAASFKISSQLDEDTFNVTSSFAQRMGPALPIPRCHMLDRIAFWSYPIPWFQVLSETNGLERIIFCLQLTF